MAVGGTGVAVGVLVGVAVAVGVLVGVLVGVAVAVGVLVGIAVAVAVGGGGGGTNGTAVGVAVTITIGGGGGGAKKTNSAQMTWLFDPSFWQTFAVIENVITTRMEIAIGIAIRVLKVIQMLRVIAAPLFG